MSDVQIHSTYNSLCGYEDNHVVLMVRDPHLLYAHWEISHAKKNAFIEEFGYPLWEKSIPMLKVTNVSRNSSLYVRISNHANNWYFNVPDANCLYAAELGRYIAEEFFISLSNSNYINTPSDTVSTNTSAHFINYRDLKNGCLVLDSHKTYKCYTYKSRSGFITGMSSLECLCKCLY